MRKKKYLLPLLSTILSVGFLFGCEVEDMGGDITDEQNQYQHNKEIFDQQEDKNQ